MSDATSFIGRSEVSQEGSGVPYKYMAIHPYKLYNVEMEDNRSSFEWDEEKDRLNQVKHGVAFIDAQSAFSDPQHVILEDISHSTVEGIRYFCLGVLGDGILTVRFTLRSGRIRIFGAGYWRKGKQLYDEKNSLH